MPSYTFTQQQVGYDSGAGWVEGTAAFLFGAYVGIRFSRDGLARKLWSSPILTLTRSTGAGGLGTVTVDAVKRVQPLAWSDTNLPGVHGPLERLYSAEVMFNAANPTLAIPLPLNDATTGMRTFFGGVVAGESVNARGFALVLSWTGSNIVWGAALTATHQGDLTGLVSARPTHSRAAECPRCGGESFRETWQLDGETNTLVCPSCYDPPSVPRGPRIRISEVNP